MKTETPALVEQIETSHEKQASKERSWIFFLVFCCSSNMLSRWFRLYRFASGVGLLFGACLKITAATLARLPIAVSSLQLTIFTSSRFFTNWFSNTSRPLISWGSVFSGSTPANKIWDLQFFLVIFNYRCHSHMTGWPTTSALAWVSWKSAGRRLSVCFFF